MVGQNMKESESVSAENLVEKREFLRLFVGIAEGTGYFGKYIRIWHLVLKFLLNK